MQRSHSPTTWRHPEENDTMGSTYSCGNLAPWQVLVGCMVIAEKGHLTLWLAMSGCQVGGGEKKKKETVEFSFPWVRFQKNPLYFCAPQFHLFLPVRSNIFIMIIAIKLKK